MVPGNEELRIRSLAAMARALGRSQELSALLETAAEEACRAIRASSVSVSRLQEGTGSVRTIINVGDLGPTEVRWPEDEVYNSGDFLNLSLATSGLTTWLADVDDPDCEPSERSLLTSLGKGSSLGSPIVVDGQLWGEFYATRPLEAPPFARNEMAYVEALIAILGGAISRAQREESLEQLAYRDPLTGLLNRRALDERAAQAMRVPAGTTRQVTVLAVDINMLKQVNDTRGHHAGDQVIQSVARALVRFFARLPSTLVARVGGDEFTILACGYEPEDVVAVADEMCALTRQVDGGPLVSCGAASALISDTSTVDPSSLFAAADRAQYVAKQGGLCTTAITEWPVAVSL